MFNCLYIFYHISFFELQDNTDADEDRTNPKMKSFLLLTPPEQYKELQCYMETISKVSSEVYVKMMEEFRIELLRAKEMKLEKTEMQAEYRRALFQNILDVWEVIRQIYQQKKHQEMKRIRKELQEITRRLIIGEGVNFSKNIRSEKLAELLLDLNDLESNNKVPVTGEPIVCRDYIRVLDDLLECEFVLDDEPIVDDIPQASSDYSRELYFEVCILNHQATSKMSTFDFWLRYENSFFSQFTNVIKL